MDEVLKRFQEVHWQYADKDIAAIDEMEERLAATGRKFGLISYTDLVNGIDFHYPNISDGKSYHLGLLGEWTGLDRRIAGDCLGFISMRSYEKAKFMASALVIGRTTSQPSDAFFEWMEELDVLPDLKESTVLAFWSDQVKRAHHWYKYGKVTA